MTNVKKMILGIAFLIVSLMCIFLWIVGGIIGAILFFIFLILGGFFIIDGYLSVDDD